MDSSLADNTKSTQGSAMKAWARYCGLFNVDDTCMKYTNEELESYIAAFIGFEIGLRGLSPLSIKRVYLPAITSEFVGRGIKNNFGIVTRSAFIKYLMRGYMKIEAKIHPAGEAKKLAFTMELVKYLGPSLDGSNCKRKDDPIFRRAIRMALMFGIYFLLRKSEYLPGLSAGKFHSGLRWARIRFYTADGLRIPFENVQKGTAKFVEINIAKSKTDQLGYGRLVKHQRTEGNNCIVHRLEQWATICKDKCDATENDYIFSINGKALPIVSDKEVASAMKMIVVHLGWNPQKICVHSLRYGGATMLAAAGLPQYVIAYFGGWTADSTSLKLYTQMGGDSVAKVSGIMSRGFNKSLEESRIRSHSGT